ncbi:MAG TPA: DUF6542 domain-containing protein [Actinomycetes bacterium]|nr:DUF6542 domain-containing protein [Actinomycetes bacterium]
MSAFRAGAEFPVTSDQQPRLEVAVADVPPPPAVAPVDLPADPLDPTSAQSAPADVTGPDPASRPPRSQPRVQRGSNSGLTAPGVAVVVFAGSLLGAVVDTTIGNGLGTFFSVLFVASSVYAAVRVRPRNFLAAVVVPPLVFLLILGFHQLLAPTGHSRSLVDLTGDVISALALGAPTLWAGTVAAAAVVAVRWVRRRGGLRRG